MQNPLKALESMIASLVEGGFGRLFRSEVRPIELAHKLAREMDTHRTTSVSRTYAPNEYSVWLSPQDKARYEGVEHEVIEELCAYLLEHARREDLVLASRPAIAFHTDDTLRLGEFGIQARLTRAPEPASERGPKPLAERAPEPMAERAPEPVAERGPEPASERGPEQLAERAPEPVAAQELLGAPAGQASPPPSPSSPPLSPSPSPSPFSPSPSPSPSPSSPPPSTPPRAPASRPPAPTSAPDERGQTMIYSRPARARAALEQEREQRRTRALLTVDGRRLALPTQGGIVGRSRDCDVVLDDRGVSRHHAELRPGAEGWVVSDLGSTNGVRVNGSQVRAAELLHPGDRIELGSTEIVFDLS